MKNVNVNAIVEKIYKKLIREAKAGEGAQLDQLALATDDEGVSKSAVLYNPSLLLRTLPNDPRRLQDFVLNSIVGYVYIEEVPEGCEVVNEAWLKPEFKDVMYTAASRLCSGLPLMKDGEEVVFTDKGDLSQMEESHESAKESVESFGVDASRFESHVILAGQVFFEKRMK